MTEREKSEKGGFKEGVRQGMGVLSAFKEAIEETLQEARERGDLSPDRARGIMRDALGRVQEATEGARERLDLVTQKEFEALEGVVEELRSRVAALEAREMSGPGGTDATAAGGPVDDDAAADPPGGA